MTVAPRQIAIRSGVVRVGGAFVDGAACAVIWPILRAHIDTRTREGGQVRPEVAEALAALRMAALEHAMSANGHRERTSADIPKSWELGPTMTTGQLADRLGVGDRQARRIASAHGLRPVGRGTWATEDVEALTASRSAGAGRSPRS